MFKAVATLIVLLALYVQVAPAYYCAFGNYYYYCTWGCCYGRDCCYTAGTYWYAWTIVSLFFLVCFCACAGCGGYRYRRRYYYVNSQQPATTTVVTTANTTAYQQNSATAYQPYAPPKDAPPPYNPAGEKPPAYAY